ncbi:MAG TPA: PAS domain S-box protein [Burkholderiales bacterium]|nr:PAS domain S-box protein [Burkholderiales bacterium]
MKLKLPVTFAWEWLAQATALAGLYASFAWMGSVAAVAAGNVLVAGPASGLAIAAVWRGGYRLVPAIGVGSFAFEQLSGVPPLASAGIAFANMIEAILAVFLMRRYIAGPRLFDRVSHVFHFFLWAGLVASAPCAALGVASLGAAGNGDEFSTLWLHWWAGDVTGALVVAPVLLAWTWPGKLRWTAREWFETSVVFVILTVACVLVFGAKPMPLGDGSPVAFPILPIIVWVAARLGHRATVSATLLTCAFAVWGMLHGTGIFAATEAPLLVLHLFVGAVAMTGLVIASGVTERSDAGQAVRESEARKTAILGTAFDAILSIDNTGKVHEWNSAAERMFGYRRAEAVGRSMDELIVPLEARQHHLSGPADDLITGVGSLIGRPFELLARRADAKEIPVELAITRVPASEPPTYTVTIRDLTERKKAESALRQSEERFHLLVEGVTDYAIYMLDPEGRVATWNAGAEHLKGYRYEEIIGKPFSIFFGPEDIQRGVPEQTLKKARDGERAVYDGWRVRKDGSRFWVHGMITAMRDETGKLLGFSKVAHDMTELKRVGEALRQSEAHFRTLAEKLPHMVWTSRPDGHCDYLSPQWGSYTGVPEEKLLGLDGAIGLVHPEDRDRVSAAWKNAVQTGAPIDMELRIRSVGGGYHWFSARGSPLRDAAGRITKWLGVNTDIDEQKRTREVLETKVQERTAQLQTSLNSIEDLLYTIAHDLRAPHRSMQGFAQLLKSEYGNKLDHIARDYLERISAAAVRNDDLIRDLLEYGRLSHEAAPLAPVDLRRAVEAIVRALQGEIEKSHAHIRLGQEWPLVLANESLLKQILTNLATNALTYVPSDREPEILISASERDGKTVLRVEDNGIGIPPEQIDRVFMPFVRLPNPVNATGTGMGLAIVKKAAERMNGVLGVESTPGKGSCFKLELSTA